MKRKIILSILFIIFTVLFITAEVIVLTDGTVINGKITKTDNNNTYVDTKMGKLTLKNEDISGIFKSIEDYNKFSDAKKHSMLIRVKGGMFIMGDVLGGGKKDEKPVHQVQVDDFYIGKYEVTQKEWMDIMGNNPSGIEGDDLPVNNVSWYDVIEFCNKKSENEGLTPCYTIDKKTKDPNNISKKDRNKWIVKCDFNANGYRLPTEAEWEFAARGGTKSKKYKYSGSKEPKDIAVFNNELQPVGTKRANELGIHDMSGNIYEWCWDWYNAGYYTVSEQNNPKGHSFGKSRVLRGGSYAIVNVLCRVAARHSHHPIEGKIKISSYTTYASPRLDISIEYFGFRLARSAK